MDMRHLRSFLAVAEYLHFGRAAEAVHLSQPALSLQIQHLEDELGVKLFDRDRRRTALTPTGRMFLEQAREILRLADKSIASLRRAKEGEVGTLRIGFISTAAALIMPQLVLAFRRQYPGVELDLRNVLTTDQVTQLVDRRLDIGLLRFPINAPPGIESIPVHREPFVLLLPKSHPAASSKLPALEAVRDSDFVMYTRRMAPGFHDQILAQLHRHKVTPHIVQEAGEMFTLLSLVSAGLGVAIAPKSILLHSNDGVVARTLPADFPLSEIGIAVHADHISPSAKLFLNLASSIFPRLKKQKIAGRRLSG